MENNEPKENLTQFLVKVFIGALVLGVLAFVLFLTFGMQLGFAMFLVSMITTLIGSYLRTPSMLSRRIDLLTSYKPSEVRNQHLQDVEDSKTPRYGKQDLLFFSGLLGVLFSLPYICGLMFS